MKFILPERRGPAFAKLCLANIAAALERAKAAENPNTLYLRSLECMAEAYRAGAKR